MSWKKYLLPNPIEDIKKAWDETTDSVKTVQGKDRHKSVFSGFGKLSDPLTKVLGKGYTKVVHEQIPEGLNRAMEPFVEIGHRGNPLWWYGKKTDNDTLNYVHDFGSAKGFDVLATVAGGYAAGSSLGGGGGGGAVAGGAGGSGGGGAAAGGGGGGTAAGGGGSSSGGMFGSMDWTDPNTYMRFGNMVSQQNQQQQAQQQQLLAQQRAEEERRRREEEMRQLQQEEQIRKLAEAMRGDAMRPGPAYTVRNV
jgi:hypothetical protein